MNGGPELRLGPAVRGTADMGRSAEGKLARSAEKSATPFEALLTRHGAGLNGGSAATGEAKPLGRFLKADFRESRTTSLAALADDDTKAHPAEASAAAELVTLDPVPRGQTLAHHVAERIAASLNGAPTTSASNEGAVEAQVLADPNRRERTSSAGLAAAVAAGRKLDANGPASTGQMAAELTVTRRETHFGAMLSSAGDALAGADASIGERERDPAVPTSTAGSGLAPERAAIRQGRAEQTTIAGRATTERGIWPAKAPETFAAPATRAVEPAAISEPTSPESWRGMAGEAVGIHISGAGEARGSTPIPGASAVQPGPAPSPAAAMPAPVKVLHIELHPAELGMLEVRMRLTDGGLEIHIAATSHEALAALKSDQDALASVLRDAGHALEAVTVSLSEKSGHPSGQSSDGWQPPASGARPEAQSGSAREQGGRFDDRSPSRPENGPAFEQVKDDQYQQVTSVRPRGGLYL